MTKPILKQPSLARRLKSSVHELQRNAGRLFKGPTSGMRTDLTANGVPVLFIHNPRTGGRSLESFFNVRRLSHAFPIERLAARHWEENFVVTSIRHPVDRFFSGYFGFIRSSSKNSLVKLYGWEVKKLSPLEYLELISNHPRHIGPQVQWTDFPSPNKPRADLVLRFEEIATWEEAMVSAGIVIRDRRMPHIGKSGNRENLGIGDLGITEEEFRLLQTRLLEYYNSDFEAFGYRIK